MGKRRVGKYAQPQMRIFQCEECGERFIVPKRKGHSTANGHAKHMYCWRCKEVRKHVQIGEV